MSPYSRSAKVLMYLVASMTVATGLLLWLEHLVAPPGGNDGAYQAVGPAAMALRADRPIEPGSWQEIMISYRARVANDKTVALIATGRQSPYHFVVQPGGEIRSLPRWQEQDAGPGSGELGSRAIRICLAGQPDSNDVSPEQWDALVSLLRQLRQRCQLPAKAVRLDPQSDPHYRPNIPNQAYRLRQMLLAADIID
jgi:hypothetical protein